MTDVERYHTIVKDARVTLRDRFKLATFRFDHGQISQVCADEIPDAFLRLTTFGKSLFQTAVRLVRRNY